MINTIGKLLLSFMITGWIYAECVLLFPPTEQIGRRFVQVFSIPTHDKWPAIAASPEAKRLGGDLEVLLDKTIGKRFNIFGPRVKDLWNHKEQVVAQADLEQPGAERAKAQSGWSKFSNRSPAFTTPNLLSFSGELSRF